MARGVPSSHGIAMTVRIHSRAVQACARAFCGLLFVSLPPLAHAQTPAASEPEASTQRMVVTATRSSVPLRLLGSDVTVISAQDIAEAEGEPLVEVISRLGGVQVLRTGGPGQTSGTSIRGVGQKQSIVVVDGVRMVDSTSGQVSLETLSKNHIERIEILKGPASSIWGADAVGGVIHVITRQPSAALHAQGRAGMGSYGSSELAASLGGRSLDDRLTWQFGLARESSRGVSVQTPQGLDFNSDADGYRLKSGHLHMGLRVSPRDQFTLQVLESTLNSQYDGTEDYVYDADFNLISSDRSKDLRIRKATAQWSLAWTSRWRDGLSTEIRVGRSSLKSLSGLSETYDVRSGRDLVSVQLNWSLSDDVSTSWILEGATERGSLDGFYGSYVQTRNNHAIAFALQGGRTGSLSWQVDARREDSNVYGSSVTGRLGLRWAVHENVSVLAVTGTSFRAPTFDDLFYPGYSNPQLKSERGHSHEVGLKWQPTHAVEVSARAWRNRVTDMIEADQFTFIPYNVSEARLEGWSLHASAPVLAARLYLQSDWLTAVNERTGMRLPRRAPQQHVLGVSFPRQKLVYSADLKFLGQRPDAGKVLPSETTVNLGVSWRWKPQWTLQARLLNATDEKIQPAYGYQGLGRQVWLGVQHSPALR